MENGPSARDASRRRRWFLLGALVGAGVPIPAAVLALLVPAAERLAPLLVPGAVLLRPLSSAMASWNGAVNVLLLSVVNGLLFGAAAALLAPLLGRRRRRDDDVRPRRVRVGTVVLAALALLFVAAVAVNALAARHADQATRDLRTVGLEAGFDGADDAHVYYSFLPERLGLVSRNEEPFPYGYATLDLELDGCRLDDVAASVIPDTRGWLPRRVQMQDVRFHFSYVEPVTSDAAGPWSSVEFRTAGELLERLAETDPAAREPGYLCRLHSTDGHVLTDPASAEPAAR